jgi:hypothetical protein
VRGRVKTGKVGFWVPRQVPSSRRLVRGKASQPLERLLETVEASQGLGRLDKDSKVSKRLRRLIRDGEDRPTTVRVDQRTERLVRYEEG